MVCQGWLSDYLTRNITFWFDCLIKYKFQNEWNSLGWDWFLEFWPNPLDVLIFGLDQTSPTACASNWQRSGRTWLQESERESHCQEHLQYLKQRVYSTSSVAERDHFCNINSWLKKLFVISLNYLKNKIIQELFKMTEDQSGLPSAGPLPDLWH